MATRGGKRRPRHLGSHVVRALRQLQPNHKKIHAHRTWDTTVVKQEFHAYDSDKALLMPERKRSAGNQARALQHQVQNIATYRGGSIIQMQGPTAARSLITQGFHPMYSAGFRKRPKMPRHHETADRVWAYLHAHGGLNKTTKPLPRQQLPLILHIPIVNELNNEKALHRLRRNRRQQ